jgi:hypothetical protein
MRKPSPLEKGRRDSSGSPRSVSTCHNCRTVPAPWIRERDSLSHGKEKRLGGGLSDVRSGPACFSAKIGRRQSPSLFSIGPLCFFLFSCRLGVRGQWEFVGEKNMACLACNVPHMMYG